jgi:hypothetical protein
MRVRHVLVAMAAALAMAAPARADLDAARTALDRGDAEAALAVIRPLAEGGDVDAQTLLGQLYLDGTGVPANDSLAWSWFNRAAKAGHAEAQYRLAELYWNGTGVPRNEAEAVKWYEAAADQGHEDAQLELGLIYRDGPRQVPASPSKAHHYLTLAALQGNPEAVLALEEMFVHGTAPPDAQQEYSSTQETRALTEADRIRQGMIQWIETINQAGGGPSLRVGPEVVVAETEDGFDILVPDLVLTPRPDTVIRAGKLRIKLVAIGTVPDEPEQDLMTTRRYRVEATMPERVQIQRGLEVLDMTAASSELVGVWLPDVQVLVNGHMTLDGIALTDQAGHTVFTVDQAAWKVDLEETEPGLWSGPWSFEATQLAAFDAGRQRMSIGRFFAESRLRDFKLEDYGRMAAEMRSDPVGFMAGLLGSPSGESFISKLTELASYSAFDMSMDDLVVLDEAGTAPMGGLAHLSFGAEAARQEAGHGALRLTYRHAGLDVGKQIAGAGGELLPRDADLGIVVDHLPVETLARLMLEMAGEALIAAAKAGDEPMPANGPMAGAGGRLASALSEAGTDLSVELKIDTDASPLALSGLLAAQAEAAFGVAGDLDISIGDLDRVMALIGGEPSLAAYLPVIQSFADVAERSGDQGEAASFRVAIQPDGAVLVNGHNAIELSVGSTVE